MRGNGNLAGWMQLKAIAGVARNLIFHLIQLLYN